jgi:hypothetical protein
MAETELSTLARTVDGMTRVLHLPFVSTSWEPVDGGMGGTVLSRALDPPSVPARAPDPPSAPAADADEAREIARRWKEQL